MVFRKQEVQGKDAQNQGCSGLQKENKLGFATSCYRRKQIHGSLCVFGCRSHLCNSFLQAVSSKGRIRTIKIRIFNFKYSESTVDCGKFHQILILDDTVNSLKKNSNYFHQNVALKMNFLEKYLFLNLIMKMLATQQSKYLNWHGRRHFLSASLALYEERQGRSQEELTEAKFKGKSSEDAMLFFPQTVWTFFLPGTRQHC